MKKIVLDTDFIVNCAAFKVDYFSELERICSFAFKVYVLDKTLDELESVMRKGGKARDNAKLAKTILLKKSVGIIATKKDKIVDKLILENAEKDWVVATQDQEFKRKLKAKGIPIIVLRQKKYLEFA